MYIKDLFQAITDNSFFILLSAPCLDVIIFEDDSLLFFVIHLACLLFDLRKRNKSIDTFNTWTALIANNLFRKAAKLLMTREYIVFNWSINRPEIRFI